MSQTLTKIPDTPKQADSSRNEQDAKNPQWRNPKWWFWSGVMFVLFLTVILFIVCRYYIGWPQDTPSFITGFLGILTLAVIAFQAFIYWEQRNLMQNQWRAMQRGLSLTEETFYLSERAYMCIKEIKMTAGTLRPDQINTFDFIAYNGGRTPAFNIRVFSTQAGTNQPIDAVVNDIETALHQNKSIESLILAGQGEPISYTPGLTLSADDFDLWSRGERKIFIPVKLEYEDVHRDTQSLIYWYEFTKDRGFVLIKPVVLTVNKTKSKQRAEKRRQNPN